MLYLLSGHAQGPEKLGEAFSVLEIDESEKMFDSEGKTVFYVHKMSSNTPYSGKNPPWGKNPLRVFQIGNNPPRVFGKHFFRVDFKSEKKSAKIFDFRPILGEK